jgi:hypothetical protein
MNMVTPKVIEITRAGGAKVHLAPAPSTQSRVAARAA